MNIDFWVGKNDYGVTAVFSRFFMRALQRRGCRCRSFRLCREYQYRAIEALQIDPPDLIFSFSSIRMQNGALADLISIPHVSWIVDHLFYFPELINSKKALIAVVDQEDRDWLKERKNREALYLPHATAREWFDDKEREERVLDMVFFGTFIDTNRLIDHWHTLFSKEVIEKLLFASLSILKGEQTLLQILSSLFCEVPIEFFFLLYTEAEKYIRACERISLLKVLDGPSLHVFGSKGWAKILKRAHLYPAISFAQVPAVMRKCKIVINTSLSLNSGLHERILTGLSSGALPLSYHNEALLREFGEDHTLLTYENPETILPLIHQVLQNKQSWQERVSHAQKITLLRHTFDNRAEQLMQWIASSYTH